MPSAPVHPRHPTPRRLRRVLLANLVLSVVLGLALFAMLLYLSSRHYAILHTPSAADRPLSEKTLRLLSTLDTRVSTVESAFAAYMIAFSLRTGRGI